MKGRGDTKKGEGRRMLSKVVTGVGVLRFRLTRASNYGGSRRRKQEEPADRAKQNSSGMLGLKPKQNPSGMLGLKPKA